MGWDIEVWVYMDIVSVFEVVVGQFMVERYFILLDV